VADLLPRSDLPKPLFNINLLKNAFCGSLLDDLFFLYITKEYQQDFLSDHTLLNVIVAGYLEWNKIADCFL
jgi:hypothetical protein